MIEDAGYIISIESIVSSGGNCACGGNSEDGDDECRCVRTEDPDALMAEFTEVVCEAPGIFGEVAVG